MNRLDNRKTILVTGGLGFIGSHFVERVLAAGHKVINVDKMTYAANKTLRFRGDYELIVQDIAELQDLPYCDIVVNFAAESHVDNSIRSSEAFVRSNVLGVHNLLEHIKNKRIQNLLRSWSFRCPLFVQISTDEVFGDILEGAFKEEDRHLPSNPYSATKSCAEQLVYSWGRTYNIPFIITRTTNNFGARQHPEKLIPAAISRLLNGQKVMVHGNGQYVRNWIHVEDNVEALLTIIDRADVNASYHIATEEELSVEQVVRKICSAVGKRYEDCVDFSVDRSGADVRYALNYERTKALGWKPTRTLDQTIAEIIKFYREKQNDSSIQSPLPEGDRPTH